MSDQCSKFANVQEYLEAMGPLFKIQDIIKTIVLEIFKYRSKLEVPHVNIYLLT